MQEYEKFITMSRREKINFLSSTTPSNRIAISTKLASESSDLLKDIGIRKYLTVNSSHFIDALNDLELVKYFVNENIWTTDSINTKFRQGRDAFNSSNEEINLDIKIFLLDHILYDITDAAVTMLKIFSRVKYTEHNISLIRDYFKKYPINWKWAAMKESIFNDFLIRLISNAESTNFLFEMLEQEEAFINDRVSDALFYTWNITIVKQLLGLKTYNPNIEEIENVLQRKWYSFLSVPDFNEFVGTLWDRNEFKEYIIQHEMIEFYPQVIKDSFLF